MPIQKCGVAIVVTLLFTLPSAYAQAPDSISFEGFLTDNVGNPINAAGLGMTFTLYRNSSSIWSEQQSVDVDEGVFRVYLGAVVSLDTVAFGSPLELGIKIDSEPSEMSPRTPLAAAPYARALPGFYTYYREDGSNSGYNVVGGASNNGIGSGVIGATIAGGGGTAESASAPNQASANFATVGGGHGNTASGIGATVPGGEGNQATGRASFAAGDNAQALHDGTFVWNNLASTNTDQVVFRAANGFGINTAPTNDGLHVIQSGLTRENGIRLEDGNGEYWDVYIDFGDDYNFSVNNATVSYIQDQDGSYVQLGPPPAQLRVSQNVQPYEATLDKVLQLNPVKFRDARRGIGTRPSPVISAAEVEPLFPELVSEKDGVKGMNVAGLSIVAIKAIQELHELVEQQQAEIGRLSRLVDDLGR